MKRILALALSATMVLSLAACVSAKAPVNTANAASDAVMVEDAKKLVGGWTHSTSPALTDEQHAIFDKALDGLVGSNVTPVAYLGSQIVAGTNHCFLCQSTAVYPDAQPSYVLVYVNEGLDGNATLMNIADLDIGSFCEYGDIENNDIEGGAVQIANPFVDYESLADAAQAAGFELTAPEAVKGYDTSKVIQVMSNRMIQIIFLDGNENRLFIRKEAGEADISGDYNEYDTEKVVTVNDCDVTFKGNAGTVSTAIWTRGGYSYAIYADVPLHTDVLTALVAQIT